LQTTEVRLQTERLVLRRPTLDDAEAITQHINHPDIARNTLRIPNPYTLDDARDFLSSKVTASWDSVMDERTCAVARAADGQLIGLCGIHPQGWDRAEIGYWFGAAFWGNGYGTEAARRLIQYGFEEMGLYRVQATYFSWNIASRRVMEKAGMQYEGMLRGYLVKDGDPIDAGICAITRPDWEANQT
jgi:[ribosomal protein S5]-alanine N-acetyltransferase